jgi:hypothetical protein
MISSMMNAGVTGVQNGYDMLNRSADQIAKLNVPVEQGGTEDYLTPVVEQSQGEIQVKASAEVVETASETLGTLIDIKV